MIYIDLDNVSHFDGKSASEYICPTCGLNTDKNHITKSDKTETGVTDLRPNNAENRIEQFKKIECLPCSKFSTITLIKKKLDGFSLPSAIMLLLILLVEPFKVYNFLIPVLAIVLGLPMLLSTGYNMYYVYSNMEDPHKITHMIRYSRLRGLSSYYDKALEYTRENDIDENLTIIIEDYLVENILLSIKPNPMDFIENWSSALEKDEEEFVDDLFKYTKIIDGFDYDKGISVLPDLWKYIRDEDIKIDIMDQLEDACTRIDEDANYRLYFLEDLYLVEEDLYDLIEEYNKWPTVKEKLDNFEPESPPKNIMEQFMAQAQESSRSMELQQKSHQNKKLKQ